MAIFFARAMLSRPFLILQDWPFAISGSPETPPGHNPDRTAANMPHPDRFVVRPEREIHIQRHPVQHAREKQRRGERGAEDGGLLILAKLSRELFAKVGRAPLDLYGRVCIYIYTGRGTWPIPRLGGLVSRFPPIKLHTFVVKFSNSFSNHPSWDQRHTFAISASLALRAR